MCSHLGAGNAPVSQLVRALSMTGLPFEMGHFGSLCWDEHSKTIIVDTVGEVTLLDLADKENDIDSEASEHFAFLRRALTTIDHCKKPLLIRTSDESRVKEFAEVVFVSPGRIEPRDMDDYRLAYQSRTGKVVLRDLAQLLGVGLPIATRNAVYVVTGDGGTRPANRKGGAPNRCASNMFEASPQGTLRI